MKRIVFAGLGLLALVVPALAGPRDDVIGGISRCGGIADDRTWLDCVYGAAQPMRAQLGLQPAPAAQQKLVPPGFPGAPVATFGAAAPVQRPAALAVAAPPPAPRQGFFMRMLTPKRETPEPPTRLATYKFDGSGAFLVTLANGETWSQDIGDTARARWNKPAQTYVAQILPSSSDYHWLKVGPEQYMVHKE